MWRAGQHQECICEFVDVLGPGYPLMHNCLPWCEHCHGGEIPDPMSGECDYDPDMKEDE